MRDDYLERQLAESLDAIVVDANSAHARYRTATRGRLRGPAQFGLAFAAGAAVASFLLFALSGSSAPERVTIGLVSTLRQIGRDERPQPVPSQHAETASPSPSHRPRRVRAPVHRRPLTAQAKVTRATSDFGRTARSSCWVRPRTNLKGGIETQVMMRRFILLASAFAGGALILGGMGTASVYLLAPAASITSASSPAPKESQDPGQFVASAPEPAESPE